MSCSPTFLLFKPHPSSTKLPHEPYHPDRRSSLSSHPPTATTSFQPCNTQVYNHASHLTLMEQKVKIHRFSQLPHMSTRKASRPSSQAASKLPLAETGPAKPLNSHFSCSSHCPLHKRTHQQHRYIAPKRPRHASDICIITSTTKRANSPPRSISTYSSIHNATHTNPHTNPHSH
jgi:hypothetical protein